MGPGSLVYSVTSLGPNAAGTPGEIGAYSLADGVLVWSRRVPQPPNQFPAVARLIKGRPPSLVSTTGTYQPTGIHAFDAATGAEQWYRPGPYAWPSGVFNGAAGDADGFPTRSALGMPRQMCLPNAWGNPSIDAAG